MEHLVESNDQANSVYSFVGLVEEDFCRIDHETAISLELLENNADAANRRHSLLGHLNANTSTTSGARLLKHSIMNPFCHLASIEHRLDCVEFLVNRVDILSIISNGIKKFGQGVDLEKVVSSLDQLSKSRSTSLSTAEKRLEVITTIDTLVKLVDSILDALEAADHTMFEIYKSPLTDQAYQKIIQEIDRVLAADVGTTKIKRLRMFKIKEGVEPLFDIARSTYNIAVNDLEQYVTRLRTDDKLPWKLSYLESRGFYLSVAANQVPKNYILSSKYIRVVKTRSIVTATTQELMQSNVRANVSYENSMTLANNILADLIVTITAYSPAIKKLVEVVAMLDLITCFAKLVVNSNGSLCRPRFTPTDTIISKSRHPILETVLSVNQTQIVPNDIVLSAGHKNFMLVTGPNMGGKSIYLKQIALIQIMAQLGCYIPAESGDIKLMNSVVVRSGTSDDNSSSCSSFMREMIGITSALAEGQVSGRSVLYIIDEVGRGTSIEDGASYSFSIAEELASRKNSFTIFATHFDQVFSLTLLYPNIVPYHFEYEEIDDEENEGDKKLKISHHLISGLGRRNNYGIMLAENCGFPEEIIRAARKESHVESMIGGSVAEVN